jgi:hypothetical protein
MISGRGALPLVAAPRTRDPALLALRRGRRASAVRMSMAMGASALLLAGVDSSAASIPDLDGFYFAGVLVCVVCAGLLQYQSYGGKVGLGNYLSKGPEDKNWERRQARTAMEKDYEMNKQNQGSWLANLLPKLDFVEVYGQEKDAPPGGPGGGGAQTEKDGVRGVAAAVAAASRGEIAAPSADQKGKEVSEVQQLTADMVAAIDKQDFAKAAELKEKLKALLEDK